jgi:hypothetical protein
MYLASYLISVKVTLILSPYSLLLLQRVPSVKALVELILVYLLVLLPVVRVRVSGVSYIVSVPYSFFNVYRLLLELSRAYISPPPLVLPPVVVCP